MPFCCHTHWPLAGSTFFTDQHKVFPNALACICIICIICIWMDGIITLPAYHYIVIVSFSIYVCSYMPLDHSTRAEFRWWWRWWYLQLLGVVCVIESILFCSVLLVSMSSLWVSRAVRPEMIYLTERGVVLVLLGSVLCYAVAKMASAKLEICQKPLFFRRFNWIVAIKLASE